MATSTIKKNIKMYTITATTSYSGAVNIGDYIHSGHICSVRYADTHVGLVYMRDRSYFTCCNANMQPLANEVVILEVLCIE